MSNRMPVTDNQKYSFGAPRIGNKLLVDHLEKPKQNLGRNFRVTHYNDPVPRLPPAFLGYAHYLPEIYIGAKNGKTVTLADILQLDAMTTSKGNEQFTMLDVEAHGWYLNAISACYAANQLQDNTTTGNDLATLWAGTIIQVMELMGNNTLTLLGGRTTPALVAGMMAGLIATMSNDAAKALLSLIPGGWLAIPFLPNNGFLGAITGTTVGGIIELAITSGLIPLKSFNGTNGTNASSPVAPNSKPMGSSFVVANHL